MYLLSHAARTKRGGVVFISIFLAAQKNFFHQTTLISIRLHQNKCASAGSDGDSAALHLFAGKAGKRIILAQHQFLTIQ